MGNALQRAEQLLKTDGIPPTISLEWEEFAGYICEMNRRCRNQINSDNEYICFALKKGTTDTPLWKATVRICCLKMNATDNTVKSYRFFNLTEFLNVYRSYLILLKPAIGHERPPVADELMNQSIYILGQTAISDGTCAICMERPNETLLPCLHSFCTVCIANWFEHRPRFKCPLCKEAIKDPLADSWEVTDAPTEQQVQDYFMGITGAESSTNVSGNLLTRPLQPYASSSTSTLNKD
ncbi:unnamed protein product, partial [Mesorhabditis belari]|uniref:RING-type domain-containing protein n=1 Tax=Mesorhabditis belari TaxID=2138241 RepID=A0AAF3J932_9BILA